MSSSSTDRDYEEAVRMVELAMEDHANARDHLERAESRLASRALFSQAVAEGTYNAHEDLEEDYKEFASIVEDYLSQDASDRLDRAVKLATIEDKIEEITEPTATRRGSLRWLIAGGAMVSAGAIGQEILDEDKAVQVGKSGKPPGVGSSLKTRVFDVNLDKDLKGYGSHIESLGDVPDEVNELGRELDRDIGPNSPDDWQLGFKDDYLELEEVDGEGYDTENWGLVQLYDPSPDGLQGFGERVMPKQAYEDAKDIADRWTAG